MSSDRRGIIPGQVNYGNVHPPAPFSPPLSTNQLVPPPFVPERTAVTPGTTFLPGSFIFWVHNDEIVKEASPGFSSSQFFRAHPDGAYTACRTIERWSVMDYDTHLERLASIISLEPSKSYFGPRKASFPVAPVSIPSPSTSPPSSSSIQSTSTLKSTKRPKWRPSRQVMQQFVSPIIKRLLTRFDQHDNHSKRELRLTMLISHRFDEHGVWKGKLHFSDHHEPDATSHLHGINGNITSHVLSSQTREFEKQQTEFFEMYDVWVFGEYLPEIPAPPINVDMIQAERHNPTVKHADWTTERKKLEMEGCVGSNEMLLIDAHGNVYEGLSSNFVAILKGNTSGIQANGGQNSENSNQSSSLSASSGKATSDGNLSGIYNHEFGAQRSALDSYIMTAPDSKVLSGTIRSLLVQCARESNIHVKFECPNLSDLKAGKWESCAIMSTSRLLLPITSIIILEASHDPESHPNGAHGGYPSVQEEKNGNVHNSALPDHQASLNPAHHVEVVGVNGEEAQSGVKIQILASDSPPTQTQQKGHSHRKHPHPRTDQQQMSTNITCDTSEQKPQKSQRFISESLTATYPLQATSSHFISSVHTFQPNHPTMALLQHHIARKMLLSATSLLPPDTSSSSTSIGCNSHQQSHLMGNGSADS